jgi:hypothetical protein
MELTILTGLVFLRRVLTISAAVVLPVLVFRRAGEWLRSRRQAFTRPLAGAAGPRPGSDRENERAFRISQARWKLLL